MLKNRSIHKMVAFFSIILLVIGIILTGIGFSMNKDLSFLKDNGYHKWYQVISIDDKGRFHMGVSFDNGIQMFSIL